MTPTDQQGTATPPPPPKCPIRFGTDGWRGVIADDFTFANVRWAARAVASYLIENENHKNGIAVGYDCRFLSDRFARAAAEEVAAAGIPVQLSSSYSPTPAISYAILNKQLAGGILITASHNRWQWNGFKFKASFGGSANPEIIRKIEAGLPAAQSENAAPREPLPIDAVDLVEPYLQQIERVVDMKSIAESKLRILADPMYGAARGYFTKLCSRHGIPCEEIHATADPLFGGLHPEPIEPHIRQASEAVVDRKAGVGFLTDGDADRVGAIDRDGSFIDSHKIFSILLRYLVEVRKMRGKVIKSFSATKLVDHLASKYSLTLEETPIGFKYICDKMREGGVLMGGEESGGIGIPTLGGPERDGMLNAFLLAEAMAHYGKSLGELVAELHGEFGPHHYNRLDLELKPGQKERAMKMVSADGLERFAGCRVERREDLDGVKMYLDNGAWLLVRPSGTEPLLRAYVEAGSAETVRQVLSATEQTICNL